MDTSDSTSSVESIKRAIDQLEAEIQATWRLAEDLALGTALIERALEQNPEQAPETVDNP